MATNQCTKTCPHRGAMTTDQVGALSFTAGVLLVIIIDLMARAAI